MSIRSLAYTNGAILVALTITVAIYSTSALKMEPSYATSTFDPSRLPDISSPTDAGATGDEENFSQFMECMFGGDVSEEDISDVLEGSGDSTPTEQEIRDCFAPLYNTGSTTDATSTTDEGDETGNEGSDDDAETPEDEEELAE